MDYGKLMKPFDDILRLVKFLFIFGCGVLSGWTFHVYYLEFFK